MMDQKYYKKGHITVFLSLILTLILSVICTTIESARLQGVKVQIQNITDMGIYSAFGEYNKDLLEVYDLFFLDMGYGTKDGSKERVNAKIKEYADYNADVNKNLEAVSLLYQGNIWRTNVEEVITDHYVLSTDKKGKAYYSQAVDYMENKLGISLAKSLIGQYDESIIDKQDYFKNYQEAGKNNQNEIDKSKEEYKADYEAQLEEADGDESAVSLPKPKEVENPIDTIKTLQSASILNLVLDDTSKISKKKIRKPDKVVSKRSLKKGNGSFDGKGDDLLNKALFNEYLFEKFPNFLTEKNDDSKSLQYQVEYILCGKSSDKANLESVVNKLLLMREGINLVYLLTDSVKVEEAALLATAIVGYLGPGAVLLLQALILLAWAFAESVIEVRMLLEGKKVAILKNSQNWNLSLSNLGNLTEQLDSGKEDKGGLDYEGYLKVLVFFSNKDKKVMRSLDLIELTIQTDKPKFKIDNCTQGFTTVIQYNTDGLFLRLPFKTIERGSESYQYSVTKDFSYY